VIEDHVVSLELAKELKSLGVKQESVFVWIDASGVLECTYFAEQEDFVLVPSKDYAIVLKKEEGVEEFSAFLLTELLEMLDLKLPLEKLAEFGIRGTGTNTSRK